MNDAMTQADVVLLMLSSRNESEWNANCATVKAAFDGYPEWWVREIQLSGLAADVQAHFERDDAQ